MLQAEEVSVVLTHVCAEAFLDTQTPSWSQVRDVSGNLGSDVIRLAGTWGCDQGKDGEPEAPVNTPGSCSHVAKKAGAFLWLSTLRKVYLGQAWTGIFRGLMGTSSLRWAMPFRKWTQDTDVRLCGRLVDQQKAGDKLCLPAPHILKACPACVQLGVVWAN